MECCLFHRSKPHAFGCIGLLDFQHMPALGNWHLGMVLRRTISGMHRNVEVVIFDDMNPAVVPSIRVALRLRQPAQKDGVN